MTRNINYTPNTLQEKNKKNFCDVKIFFITLPD